MNTFEMAIASGSGDLIGDFNELQFYRNVFMRTLQKTPVVTMKNSPFNYPETFKGNYFIGSRLCR